MGKGNRALVIGSLSVAGALAFIGLGTRKAVAQPPSENFPGVGPDGVWGIYPTKPGGRTAYLKPAFDATPPRVLRNHGRDTVNPEILLTGSDQATVGGGRMVASASSRTHIIDPLASQNPDIPFNPQTKVWGNIEYTVGYRIVNVLVPPDGLNTTGLGLEVRLSDFGPPCDSCVSNEEHIILGSSINVFIRLSGRCAFQKEAIDHGAYSSGYPQPEHYLFGQDSSGNGVPLPVGKLMYFKLVVRNYVIPSGPTAGQLGVHFEFWVDLGASGQDATGQNFVKFIEYNDDGLNMVARRSTALPNGLNCLERNIARPLTDPKADIRCRNDGCVVELYNVSCREIGPLSGTSTGLSAQRTRYAVR